MFIWKVEDMALIKETRGFKSRDLKYHRFHAESTTSREDKIAFVDQFTEGRLSYLLTLIEQFNKDVINMPRDMWDAPKTVSVIGWVRRNDKKYESHIIDISYKYGQFYICGTERYIQNANTKGAYDMYDDIVDECFRRQLKECLSNEQHYFRTHDTYEVAKTTVREKAEKYGTTFGMRLCFSSNGTITVADSEDHFNGPEITLNQCRILLDAYDEVEQLIDSLSFQISGKME